MSNFEIRKQTNISAYKIFCKSLVKKKNKSKIKTHEKFMFNFKHKRK